MSPRDDWRTAQESLLSGDRWIADGNYGGTFDSRFEHADTVVVLQPPRLVCVRGALGRQIRNRGRDVQAAGCPEHLDLAFLRWIWRYPVDSRRRLDDALARHPHLHVVELRSRRAAADFLGSVSH